MSAGDTRFIRIVVVSLFAASLVACDLCGNELIEEIASPHGKYVASIFERNCGATTPYLRVVSLRVSDAKFNPVAKDDWVFRIYGQAALKVSWVKNETLRVPSYPETGERPLREKWKDVVISSA